MRKPKFKFIDLFAGIGGFHLAMHDAGGQCVFASEWDKHSRVTYEANYKDYNPELFFKGNFNADINDADPHKIPDFDVLCAGFPCQPFSSAGLRKGFSDTRGTLFFNIAEIIRIKKEKKKPPAVILLENVKGLKGHDKGNTLKTIVHVLTDLGYNVNCKVLNSKYFGVPQNRERLFIVAWLAAPEPPLEFYFPLGLDENNNVIFDGARLAHEARRVKLGDILLPSVEGKYTLSDKLYEGHLRRSKQHKEKGNGFGFSVFDKASSFTSTISARYYKDGSEILIKQKNANPRKLHPKEAGLLQGYPVDNGFKIVVSDTQAYRQFGNSVSVPVVKALAKEIVKQLLRN